MIVKMKRYAFLVYHKQYIEFLERIKEIGVLHVIEKPEGITENDQLRDKMQTAARVKTILKKLEALRPKKTEVLPADSSKNGLELLHHAEKALNEKESLFQKLMQAEKESDRMEVWGNFSHERIAELKDACFVLSFYSCPERKFNQEWEVVYNAFEIDQVGSTKYFVTVTRPGEVVEVDADYVTLSDKTSEQLQADIQTIRTQIEENKTELEHISIADYNTLKEAEAEILTDIAFDKVMLNTQAEADNKVMLLEGWCPVESEQALNEYLNSSDIYFETSEPTEEDKVPIKLKNNKFAKMFEFIGELYDLPNYHEIDLTPYFAPFYLLFFGLCLGDAGYGLLLLVLGLVFRTKMTNPAYKSVMTLIAWLGGATIIIGLLCGTVFGYSLFESDATWLQKVKNYLLDSNKLFYNALALGVIQIIFGMFVKLFGQIRRFGFLASLSTLGWLFIILGVGGTAGLATFGIIQPEIAKWLYILFGALGFVCAFLLNDIKRNPLVNVGVGLWDSYNMVTGMMGDVLSYIRLFALGLSGGVMGLVFNNLAISMGEDIGIVGVSQLVTIIILLFGHSINIFIAALGAFVHPMRLTFVEFYKNAGFEGGGKKYRPFARYEEETKIL